MVILTVITDVDFQIFALFKPKLDLVLQSLSPNIKTVKKS